MLMALCSGLVVGRNRAVETRQRVGASRTRQAIRDASNMLAGLRCAGDYHMFVKMHFLVSFVCLIFRAVVTMKTEMWILQY